MKQTAVEWLLNQIDDIYVHQCYSKEFQQAKEIEKKQIITAYNKAVPFKFGKQYYNETFKNDENTTI